MAGDLISSMNGDQKKSITPGQIDELTFFLGDQNDVVRMYAAKVLGRIGGSAERAIPKLESALKSRAHSPLIVDPDLGSDSAIYAALIRIRESK